MDESGCRLTSSNVHSGHTNLDAVFTTGFQAMNDAADLFGFGGFFILVDNQHGERIAMS
jgi:hypothetical protein